jgi:hypothetical protein
MKQFTYVPKLIAGKFEYIDTSHVLCSSAAVTPSEPSASGRLTMSGSISSSIALKRKVAVTEMLQWRGDSKRRHVFTDSGHVLGQSRLWSR